MEMKTVNELWIENELSILKGKVNLLVAPAGSGKTYFIFETLIKDYELNKVLYLCDTSNLEEAVAKDENYFNKCHIIKERYIGFEPKVTVMTYSMYGQMLERDNNIFDKFDLIICDEAHNLYNYRSKFDSKEEDIKIYQTAIKDLFTKAKSKKSDILFMTATHNRIMSANRLLERITYVENGELIEDYGYKTSKNINIINMEIYPNIKSLKEDFTKQFGDYRQIGSWFKSFNRWNDGMKALIYTDRIETCKNLVGICEDIGLNAVAIWSKHNTRKGKTMDGYQKEVRQAIIEKGIIPEGINVLIINSSYETGINIKDKNIEIVIVNSTDEDTQIQSRSRVRKDIKLLMIRTKLKEDIEIPSIIIPEKYLDIALTTDDKKKLCEEVKLISEKGRLVKWSDLKKEIIEQDYKVYEDRGTIIRNKRTSTITDTLEYREENIFGL